MGSHRKLRIYIGYNSLSIIKYLEPLTVDLFTVQYADCIFDEKHFSILGRDFKYQKEYQKINWNVTNISSLDSRTQEFGLQVRIINLQHITNNMSDAFNDNKDVVKSYNLARNMPERIEVPNKITLTPKS